MLHIYKSSAGSGKTYTLVREYLRMALTSTDNYKRILAITFTNKAAAEMKERILDALDGISKGNSHYDNLSNDLMAGAGFTRETLQRKASEVLRQILHNYADVSVSTIDSFVHRVVRSFAYDLRLPLNFEIEMDDKKLLSEAVALMLDRLGESDPQITQAILDFAVSKIEEGKSWNIDRDLTDFGRQLFYDDVKPFVGQLGEIDFNKLKEIKEQLFKKQSGFETQLFEEGKKAYQLMIQNGLTAKDVHYAGKGLFGFFEKYANGVFPNDMRGNSFVLQTINEDKWGAKFHADAIKPALVEHYNKIIKLIENGGKDYYLAQLLARNFYSFILLADLQKLLEELKNDNNILHISDFQQKVFEIVRQQEAPVIYERIGEMYKNILIDEFQDTSVVQWQNLVPLVENSQLNMGDSLIVGDGKQAIYRFRGGEVGQIAQLPGIYGSETDELLKEREIVINNYGVKPLTLQKNYRSRKEIIDFNNLLYKNILDWPELKHKAIYEDYFQQQGRKTEGGFVSIEFLKENGPRELEYLRNERIEEIIQQVIARGYSYKDIAVLTRSNKNASVIASYLIERGIKVVSPESLLIDFSPKVRLLLSTLRYIDRRDNFIARAEMLYYFSIVKEKEADMQSITFKSSFADFESKFSKLTGLNFDSLTFPNGRITDLVLFLKTLFGFTEDDPFIQFFLDEVLVYTSRYGNRISEFLIWWEEVKSKKSIIYPEGMNAVKIMTMHKSKGLQFPVVILADVCGKIKLQKKYFWVPLQKDWLPQLHIGVLPVNKAVLETEFAALYEQETDNSFLDTVNLLYVGTTRPEDALYVLSTEVKSDKGNLDTVEAILKRFLTETSVKEGREFAFWGNADYINDNTQRKAERALFKKGTISGSNRLAQSVKIRTNPALLWKAETKEKIDEGLLLHNLLRYVKTKDDLGNVVRRAIAQSVVPSQKEEHVTEKLKAIISHPSLEPYFLPGAIVITERAIFKKGNARRVPDRVVLKGDEAVLIDYKTGEERPEYSKQLSEYAELLHDVGYRVSKRILFYTNTLKAVEV